MGADRVAIKANRVVQDKRTEFNFRSFVLKADSKIIKIVN